MALTDFIARILPAAQQTSAQTGLPLDFIIAQSELETGAGSSNAANNYNNWFGISPGGSLGQYPSLSAGFQAYSNLVNNRYSGAAAIGSPSGIADYFQSSGYAADANYASKIKALLPAVDANLASMGISAPTNAVVENNAGGQAPPACAFCDKVNGWLQSGAVFILGVVVVGGGVWMLAKK